MISKPIFYLAHPILSRSNIRKWELRIESKLNIDLKNPFYDGAGYENGNIQKIDAGALGVYDRKLDWKALVETDLDSIDSCDGILAICDDNLTIGAPMELMYAKLNRIPIIVICSNEKTQSHPWLRYCSDKIFYSINSFEKWSEKQYISEKIGIRVGLSGKSKSGKDTVAELLNISFRFAFADKLKDVSKTIFSFNRKQIVEKPEAVRKTFQNLGTEAVRNIFPMAWVDSLERTLLRYERVFPLEDIAVTDVRYLNEASMLQKRGYKIVRIFRPQEEKFVLDNHSSETELDNVEMDYLVINNGTRNQLKKKVDDLRVSLEREFSK